MLYTAPLNYYAAQGWLVQAGLVGNEFFYMLLLWGNFTPLFRFE